MPDHTTLLYGARLSSPSDGNLTMTSVPSIGSHKRTRDTVIRMTDLSQTRALQRQEPSLKRAFLPPVPLNREGRIKIGQQAQHNAIPSTVSIGGGSSSDSCSSEIEKIFAKDERLPAADHPARTAGHGEAATKQSQDRHQRRNENNHRGGGKDDRDDDKRRKRRNIHPDASTLPTQPLASRHVEGPRTWVLLIFVLCFLATFFAIWLGMMMAIVKRLNPNMT